MRALVVSRGRTRGSRRGSFVEEDTDAHPARADRVSRRDEFRSLVVRSRQVVLASAVVGAITGVAVAGFDRLSVDVVFDRGVAHLPLWLMAFAPGVGLAVATLWLRIPGRGLTPGTADEYLHAFHTRQGLGVRPRPGNRNQRVATARPTPGANAMSHSGRCATPRSKTTLTVSRSKPATATPVTAPTTADASTT